MRFTVTSIACNASFDEFQRRWYMRCWRLLFSQDGRRWNWIFASMHYERGHTRTRIPTAHIALHKLSNPMTDWFNRDSLQSKIAWLLTQHFEPLRIVAPVQNTSWFDTFYWTIKEWGIQFMHDRQSPPESVVTTQCVSSRVLPGTITRLWCKAWPQ